MLCTLIRRSCTSLLSPPYSGWPHVTTDLSPRIAAKAPNFVSQTLWTSLRWLWTRLLSPPHCGSLHVTTPPPQHHTANAPRVDINCGTCATAVRQSLADCGTAWNETVHQILIPQTYRIFFWNRTVLEPNCTALSCKNSMFHPRDVSCKAMQRNQGQVPNAACAVTGSSESLKSKHIYGKNPETLPTPAYTSASVPSFIFLRIPPTITSSKYLHL